MEPRKWPQAAKEISLKLSLLTIETNSRLLRSFQNNMLFQLMVSVLHSNSVLDLSKCVFYKIILFQIRSFGICHSLKPTLWVCVLVVLSFSLLYFSFSKLDAKNSPDSMSSSARSTYLVNDCIMLLKADVVWMPV